MTEIYSSDEMMTIAASRSLTNKDVCFVGIGAPSAACNVARLTHAPEITLIYESGTIGIENKIIQKKAHYLTFRTYFIRKELRIDVRFLLFQVYLRPYFTYLAPIVAE